MVYNSAVPAALLTAITAAGENALNRELERSLPHEEIRSLVEAGIGRLRVPTEYGGLGLNWVEATEVLVELAAQDSNIVQALRGHLAIQEDAIFRPDDQAAAQHWLHRLAAGQLAGNAWTEPGTGGYQRSGTVVTSTENGLVVNGTKYYTTGSIFADWLDVTARDEQGNELAVLVAGDQAGVQISDDWSGFGQRTTGSGTTTLTDAAVADYESRLLTDRFPYQTALYQHVLLVVLTGIVEAAAGEIAAALSTRSRTYSHANTVQPSTDPQLLQAVGEVDAVAALARAQVLETARTLDTAFAARHADPAGQLQAAEAAELATGRAQVALHRPVLEAVSRTFDALGASGVDAGRGLDRHWRNARTVTSHNPWVYKARIAGDHRVNGTAPVRLWSVGVPEPELSAATS
ncbi:acyl-CoA dehydrogenase family protein [Garicola koreensis]|uniref:Alkylation response protein AidB-like acyl-CoA dehydrogenase n=1 Tax=Garicola koreensis TaxID=1262554 RepID=A0A7W5TRX7_9MICC|nr:acyl-CoA dehydrogenase family protein [Garicola koreensis]MBB3668080.1 alkylation response protein AidB-like acyl-CoA dehydrogenase [Garicola koreensis]